MIHPVLKRACPSEKIPSHVFMNRAINMSPNVCHAVDKMGDTRVRFKCAMGTVCCTGGARTPIPSKRARLSSVVKIPSFSFSQVDMYVTTSQHFGKQSL